MTPEDRARRAFVPVREAIDAGRVPGAVLGIIATDGTRAVLHAGLAQKVPEPVPMRRNTVFDLASLTKVVFTATRVMEFMAEHRIAPHQPLADAIPDLRQYAVDTAMERRITVLQCLTHRTSLPAVEPLYTLGLDPATLRAYVLQREWPSVPPVYSDINFILLGILIERLSGQPLNRQPLDHGFTFRPVTADCASTEHCTWRGRVIRGEVHDENAFALGGAAGHAGLFGNADALLDFAHGLLSGTRLPAAFRTRVFERQAGDRSFGWQVVHDGWSAGAGCGPRAIGHTGFTGTGLWIDPDAGLAWVLLTNRVHPTRHAETGIVALRQEVGQRVLAAP